MSDGYSTEEMEEADKQHFGEDVKLITLRKDMEGKKRKRSTALITILSSSCSILHSILKNARRVRTILPLKVVVATLIITALMTFFYYWMLPKLPSSPLGDGTRLSSSVAALRHAKHWCLYHNVHGGQDGNFCRCPNPLEPLPPRDTHSKYLQFHENNVKLASAVERKKDIVFLGDSITQHWLDRKDNKIVFDKFFTQGVGKLDGLALGVSGDTVSSYLLFFNFFNKGDSSWSFSSILYILTLYNIFLSITCPHV